MTKPPRPTLSIYQLIVLVTLVKPLSNLFLAWGMHQTPLVTKHPVYLFLALIKPMVTIGILMQIAWLVLRMSLLSVADLGFVLPVTAAGYVLSTILGRLFLHEEVSMARWIGAILISSGAAIVSMSPRMTSAGEVSAK